MSAGRRAGALVAAGALITAGLASCSTGTDNRPTEVVNAIQARQAGAAVVTAPTAAAPAAATCTPAANASYRALAAVPTTLPSGSLEAAIKARGYLVVGVSGDTRLLGARDNLTDPDPAGFDIEIARAVGRAILGPNADVRFKVITAADRFSQVNKGEGTGGVDMVARAVSMTCDRWQSSDSASGSAFSVAYLMSDQRVLVRQGVSSLAQLIKDKQAAKTTAKICAPSGSTSIAKITGMPGVTPVPVAIHSDCLALWQEGRVDAITGDDVILAGFKVQDPTAAILTDQALANTTPYGLAISKSHKEFVQYVNAVMATPQFRAAWDAAYAQYLAGPLGSPPKAFPPPDDTRPLNE